MNVATRIVSAALLVAASQAGVYALNWGTGSGEVRLPQRDLRELPLQLGNWVGEDAPLDAKLMLATGANQVVNRRYRNSAGETVLVHMGIWSEYKLAFPHPPDACYPANGWQIADKRDSTLQLAGKSKGPVRLLQVAQEGERLQLLFWGQLGGELVVDRDGMRRVRRGLRGRQTWPPFIKVLLQTSAANSERGEARLRELASLVYAWTDSLE